MLDVISSTDRTVSETVSTGQNLPEHLPPAPLNTMGLLAAPETASARDYSPASAQVLR